MVNFFATTRGRRIALGGSALVLIIAAGALLWLSPWQAPQRQNAPRRAESATNTALPQFSSATPTSAPGMGPASPTPTAAGGPATGGLQTPGTPSATAAPPAPSASPAPPRSPEPGLAFFYSEATQQTAKPCPTTLTATFLVFVGDSTPAPPVSVTYHWMRLEDNSFVTLTPDQVTDGIGESTKTFTDFARQSGFVDHWTVPAAQFAGHTLTALVAVTAINGQPLVTPLYSPPAVVTPSC